MWCFVENHETPYRSDSLQRLLAEVVKLPGTSTTKKEINSLNCRVAILWNIKPKNIKLSKMLPDFQRRLKRHLIPCNCAACRFYPNNCDKH